MNIVSRGYNQLIQTNRPGMIENLKDRDAGYPTFISPFATLESPYGINGSNGHLCPHRWR